MALFYLQFLLQFAILLQAMAFQPGRGRYEGSYETQVENKDNVDVLPVKETVDCEDQVDERRCKAEKRRGRSCFDVDMQKSCAKTCRVCDKAPAPPKDVECRFTTFGCCWDGKTTQHSFDGEGCPECADNPEFKGLCFRWKAHCHNSTNWVRHEVVTQYCHRTCKICFHTKATQRSLPPKTLPTVSGEVEISYDKPLIGSYWEWTKLLRRFGYDKLK